MIVWGLDICLQKGNHSMKSTISPLFNIPPRGLSIHFKHLFDHGDKIVEAGKIIYSMPLILENTKEVNP